MARPGIEPPYEIPPLPSNVTTPGADAASELAASRGRQESTATKAKSARGGDDTVDQADDDDEPKPARRSLYDFFRKRDDREELRPCTQVWWLSMDSCCVQGNDGVFVNLATETLSRTLARICKRTRPDDPASLVELVVGGFKVRRAVQILVLTVRSATARRASDTSEHRARSLPVRTWAGGSPCLTGVESGSRSVSHSPITATAALTRISSFYRWFSGGTMLQPGQDQERERGSERLERLPSLAVYAWR